MICTAARLREQRQMKHADEIRRRLLVAMILPMARQMSEGARPTLAGIEVDRPRLPPRELAAAIGRLNLGA